MENFTRVHTAIKKYKLLPNWVIYLVIALPIFLLMSNIIAAEKTPYGGLLWFAAILLSFMTTEDSKTNMIDIWQLTMFISTLVFFAHDIFSKGFQLFIFWWMTFQVFHTITILVDILINRYRKRKTKCIATSIINGDKMPLLPPLTLAIWLYSVGLIVLSQICDLNLYAMLCNEISDVSTTWILTLFNHTSYEVLTISLLFISIFSTYKLTKNKLYKDTGVQQLKGFIAQADLLILAALMCFFQQAHFSMIIFLLPLTTRIYRLCKRGVKSKDENI